MRGTKRKRDIFTLAESVDNWFVASESAEDLPETEESEIIQGHATTVGEGSNRARPSQVGPVGCQVMEGSNRWLGLRHTIPAQLDGFEEGSSRVPANHPSPGSCHVARRTIGEGEGGLVPLGGGPVDQGGIGDAHTSLAKEAATWLEARTPSTGRP